ncbi:hypothetical protein BDR26DRAFT_855932, partial [Obelidium mucronatum]
MPSSSNGTDLLHSDDGVITIVANFQAIMATVCFLFFIGFVLFVAYTSKLSNLLASKNLLLSGLLLSSTANFGACAAYTTIPGRSTAIARMVTLSLSEVFYISVSWTRCSDVFRAQSSPSTQTFFRWIFRLTILFCLFPILTISFPTNFSVALHLTSISSTVSGFCVLVMDIFFALTSVGYIFKRTNEIIDLKGPNAKATQFFPIICRHLIVSSLGGIMMLGFFIGGSVVATQ